MEKYWITGETQHISSFGRSSLTIDFTSKGLEDVVHNYWNFGVRAELELSLSVTAVCQQSADPMVVTSHVVFGQSEADKC